MAEWLCSTNFALQDLNTYPGPIVKRCSFPANIATLHTKGNIKQLQLYTWNFHWEKQLVPAINLYLFCWVNGKSVAANNKCSETTAFQLWYQFHWNHPHHRRNAWLRYVFVKNCSTGYGWQRFKAVTNLPDTTMQMRSAGWSYSTTSEPAWKKAVCILSSNCPKPTPITSHITSQLLPNCPY